MAREYDDNDSAATTPALPTTGSTTSAHPSAAAVAASPAKVRASSPEVNKPIVQAQVRRTPSLSDWDEFERDPDSETKDSLYVPPSVIPQGFDVNWKRHSVWGKEDKQHASELKRKGWRPVPAETEGFAEYFEAFKNELSGTIENNGCILMWRPKKYSDQARAEQIAKAKNSVTEKMEEMGMTENKSIPRKVHNFERTFESGGVAVPD